MFKKYFWISIVVVGLMFSGCAKPPEQEMQQADEAMNAAVAVQADVYAPTEQALAQDATSKAQAEVEAQKAKFVLFRSFSQAKSLYAAAIEASNKAKDAAIVNKEAVKAEATTLIAEAKAATDEAGKSLRSAPRGKDTKADIDAMNADLGSLTSQLPELDDLMSKESFMDARNKAQAIKEKAMSIQSDVQAAKEKMASRRKK